MPRCSPGKCVQYFSVQRQFSGGKEAEVTERQVVEPTKLLPAEKCLLRTSS